MNCLITTLKKSVSADIPKVGELIIPISTIGLDNPANLRLSNSNATKFILDGISLSNGATEVTSVNGIGLEPGKSGTLKITDKYRLENCYLSGEIQNNPVNIENFAYCRELRSLRVNKTGYGNINTLKNCPLTNVRFNDSSIEGDVETVAYFYHNSGILKSCYIMNSNIKGSIEGLVAKLRELGHIEGNIKLRGMGSGVTFNSLPLKTPAPDDYEGTLSWTGSTITYLDETIDA